MWFDPQRVLAAIEGAARAPLQPREGESSAGAAPRVAQVAHVARPQPSKLEMTPCADEAELFEERAAIREYWSGMSRADAEVGARADLKRRKGTGK
jgi:hypothetical protein